MRDVFYVYIMASKRNGTIYIGVTNDIARRAWEHREGLAESFTRDYSIKRLVYFEVFEDVHAAIHRETRLKKWKRQWKIDLIQSRNILWDDLYPTLNI